MFVFLFGMFTAAQAMSMGPDAAKAKKAALKIFAIIDRPSEIDAISED
jgi:ABC-type multidrug transport system fused ATPase/permease subunit